MFKLRREHFEALARDIRERFEEGLIRKLQEECPLATAPLPMAAFRMRVQRAVNRALVDGLTEERDVEAFVKLTFEVIEDFDWRPEFAWARTILRDARLSGPAKLRRITERLRTPRFRYQSDAEG